MSGAAASVTVPGLAGPVTFAAPRYGIAGTVLPSSGLITTSLAARVDGRIPRPGDCWWRCGVTSRPTTWRRWPTAWSFDDLGALLPGLGILAAIPDIIPASGLGLSSFSLYLYGDAPDMSSIVLAVADIADPAKPLWSAAGGKIQLTDVVVTLNLTYSDAGIPALTGEGSVRGDFVLGTVALSAEIPSPPTGVWSLTAYPNLSLSVLDDIGSLLGYDSQQFNALLPAQIATIGGFELSYLRIAVKRRHVLPGRAHVRGHVEPAVDADP